MSKYPSQYENLPKHVQKRHFANEHGNGKGDHLREQTDETRDNFSKGYDNIDWSKK